MKKKVVKRRIIKTKKVGNKSSRHYLYGSLGIGMGFALLGIFAIIAMSVMMVGSIVPISKGGNGEPVIITTNTPEPRKSNLQLYTFPAIILTQTPVPTNPPQPQERGGTNYGSPPDTGGHHAPDTGGGSGGNPGTAT